MKIIAAGCGALGQSGRAGMWDHKIKELLMKDMENICKVALVQAEPVLFDKSASLKKALQYIDEAAGNGMQGRQLHYRPLWTLFDRACLGQGNDHLCRS